MLTGAELITEELGGKLEDLTSQQPGRQLGVSNFSSPRDPPFYGERFGIHPALGATDGRVVSPYAR